jgi:hypothetical protein
MNPARTVAAAIVYADFTGMWISLIFMFLGAVFGAFTYKAAFSVEHVSHVSDNPNGPSQFV